MWAIIKAILMKFGMLRGIFAVLGSLAAVVPIALALIKLLGWPLLVVMFVLGLPLLVILALVGFPLIAVVSIAGTVMAIAFAVISVGIVVLKFLLFVVLPIWIGWKVISWMLGRRRDNGERPAPEAAS